MIPTLVVDASVGAKWFLPEEDSPAAKELFSRTAKLVAPELFRSEVGGAITRGIRTNRIDAVAGRECCEELLAMLDRQTIWLIDSEKDFADALMLSLQLSHALADCLYLALAQRLGAPLVTADAIFHGKAKNVYAKVEML